MDRPDVLIAPDKFKGALSASSVASHLASGLSEVLPGGAGVHQHPLADGGEGTVESIVEALDGQYHTTTVTGPLGGDVEARWGTVPYEGEKTAVLEMAAASGFDLIDPSGANPMEATTEGTGELLLAAIEEDVDRIILGLGGSATVDGGLGMARALGYEFRDVDGEIIKTPESLGKLTRISVRNVPPAIKTIDVTVLSDVNNPLLGENGAARVYGPQKGADERMTEQLEANLAHWADVLEDHTGRNARTLEGTGAAGGLGFGLVVLLGGSIVSGAGTVMDVTGFNSAVQTADVVITGEGRVDRQTKHGKTPVAAARRAKELAPVPVVAVCGQRGEGYEELRDEFDVILSVVDRPMTLEDAIDESGVLLERTGRELGRILTNL